MRLSKERDKKITRIILIEGCLNLLVLLLKLSVGFASGSLAILSDALHSLTDVFNNIVVWFVVKLAACPPDREHPYGHRKFETLVIFGLASLLAILSVEILQNALTLNPHVIHSSSWALGTMLVVLVINTALASWQRWWSRRLTSDILLADATHTFADVFTTLLIIIGWQLSAAGFVWLDRAVAILMSGFILFLSYKLFRRSVPVLVDHVALPRETLIQAAMEVPGVQSVKDMRSRWIGSMLAVDMSILVKPGLTVAEAHNICNQIESQLESRFDIQDAVIHVEPN